MLNKLTENIFYMDFNHETDRPILGLVCGKKHSLIVDAGASPRHAREFLEKVNKMDIPPVKYLVITHHHADHVFGITTMNLVTIGHEITKEKLKEGRKLKWDDASLEEGIKKGIHSEFFVQCVKKEMTEEERKDFVIGDIDIVYKDSMEIDLGGLTCVIKAVGGTHTDDSTIVYIPEDKVMFVGDCIYGKRFKGGFGYDGETLFKMVDIMESYETVYWVAGHENICDRKEMDEYWGNLRMGWELVGQGTSMEEEVKAFEAKFNREPSKKELFFIESFVNRNKEA